MTTKAELHVQKMKRREGLLNSVDTFSMYICTTAGVMISKYIPMLREESEIILTLSWGQFVVTLVVAFLLLTAAEQLGGKDKAGKRKRWLWRAVAAMSYGAFWYNIIGG